MYSLRDGLIVYGSDGKVRDMNPRAVELLGATRDETIGFDPLAEARTDGAKNVEAVTRITLNPYESKALAISRPIARQLEITHVPLFSESGAEDGYLRSIHDVSSERRADTLKSNFVSTATHQLRTPLTGIGWGLDTLAAPNSGISDKQRILVEQMRNTTRYVIALVNDLLNVSELEEGRAVYQFERQNITPVIRTILDGLKVELEEKHLKTTFDEPEDSERTYPAIDRVRIGMALQNIIDNAVRYTPEGGAIKIAVRTSADALVISVSDTGIGISESDQKLLFNKFFRAPNAVHAVPDGSGLGLYLTKRIVEDHNGSISVDSAEGKGTTFSVELPLDPARMPKSTSTATDTTRADS